MPFPKALRTIKYIRIAREIETTVRKRKMLPGSPILSVRDIMKQWNVSSLSAQRALKQLEQWGIIYRVPRKGCFVKAIKLRNPDRKVFHVGYSIYDMASELKLERLIMRPEEELIRILQNSFCKLKNLNNQIFHIPSSFHPQIQGLDGLLVSAVHVNLQECRHSLADLKIPMVAIHGDVMFNMPFHQVLPDPMPGLREMFQRAKRFHLNRIIIVSHDHPNGQMRAKTCEKAAEEFGFHDISTMFLDYKENAYCRAIKLIPIIKNTLLFVCSCTIAFPFLNAFFDEKKLQPSLDYHLVCYDDVESIGVMPKPVPTMTTIDYSHEMLIRMAAEILLDEMKEPSGYTRKILVPTSLRIRKSGLFDRNMVQEVSSDM